MLTFLKATSHAPFQPPLRGRREKQKPIAGSQQYLFLVARWELAKRSQHGKWPLDVQHHRTHLSKTFSLIPLLHACKLPFLLPLSSHLLTLRPSLPVHRCRYPPSLNQLKMSACQHGDSRLERIAKAIRVIPDFPKPGIKFQDITTLLLDHKAFQDSIDIFVERFKDKNITVVAGIEARGFIFGPPIALAIGAKFVPMRKPKKLPGEVISEEYMLEYGTDRLEMHVGAVEPGDRALVVDDLIATGGTLCAAIRLLERAGAEVVECACIIELLELKGRERLADKPLFILIKAE